MTVLGHLRKCRPTPRIAGAPGHFCGKFQPRASAPGGTSLAMRRTMDAVLVVGVALAAGGLVSGTAVAGAVPLVLLLLAVGLLARRGAWLLVLVVPVVFAAGAFRARGRVASHAADAGAIPRAREGKPRLLSCDGEGTIDSSPTARGATLRLVVTDVALACDEDALAPESRYRSRAPLRGKVALYAETPMPFGRGDRVAFVAALAPPQSFVVDELGDERPSAARTRIVLSGGAADVLLLSAGRGPGRFVDRARAHVRSRIEATFPPRATGLARALVLGESDLDEDDARAFRDSGLSHLLAVSGMHLVVAVNGLVVALTALLARIRAFAVRVVPRRAASIVGLVFCWIYCDFSGGSGSAVRAACMLSVQLLAIALGRRARALRTLGWSVLLVALVDPMCVRDVSFLLSAGATLGLVALGKPLVAALGARGPALARAIGASLGTTLAATIPCAPILLRLGPAISLGGLVANLVAVPVGELAALPVCLGHALLAPLPRAEKGAAMVGGGALVVVAEIARFTSSTRLGRVPLPRPTDVELGIVAAAWLVLALGRDRSARGRGARGAAFVLALAAAELHARHDGAPRGVLRATFLDVGQGDSAIVDLPGGEAILIDAGGLVGSATDPGERVVAPVLRARRRDTLRAVIVSHPHPDHFMGLAAGLEGVHVGEVWDTGEIDGAEDGSERPFGPAAYQKTLRALVARGAALRRPGELCGVHQISGATIEVLAPCPSFSPDRGTNDNSFVVRIRYGATSMLFVGDAEHGTEADLVRRLGANLRADVLKVGHHGSRSSSTAPFLDAVDPRVAVVSCGIRNRYGHPHVATLESFAARAGTRLVRTDRAGTTVVTSDGAELRVDVARDDESGKK